MLIFLALVRSQLSEDKELMTILHVLPHLIAHPSTFKVFVETNICANSTILKDIRTREFALSWA